MKSSPEEKKKKEIRKWENVYIFISSTFNDMHAERDYLIKRVFPELRLWCNDRKLKLIDVDLRWGVSEKDAAENKRVVDVCLSNVDKCRPFLLCLLGQRRGWVPGIEDVNEATLQHFPALSQYLGMHSITELEIIHGLIHPLSEGSANMRHAFFYCRKPDYLKDITSEEVKKVFQQESDLTNGLIDEFQIFKDSLKDHYNLVDYDATWNPDKTSIELKNVHGKDLSSGRLEHFRINNEDLATCVLNQLKEAIQKEFPEHFSFVVPDNDLEKELAHQDTFLFNANDSYISRLQEENKIQEYISGNIRRPMILMADAGTGKTSLLAHLIQKPITQKSICYRFVGTSSASSDIERTLFLLCEELVQKNLLSSKDFDNAKSDLLLNLPELFQKIQSDCVIILDGIDQWNHLTTSQLRWIPAELPEHVKLILSVKKDGDSKITKALTTKNYYVQNLEKLTNDHEKISLIQNYLSQFLKDVDDVQLHLLLSLSGSNNPLYLKIVLNELRIHGSFDTLMEQLQKNYGQTPKEAFQMVLQRLERETFSDGIDSALLVRYVLGVIAHSTEGMILNEYTSLLKSLIPDCKNRTKDDIMDAVYGLVRHLSAYLTIDGNRVSFLYDSFKQAVCERYADEYEHFHMILTAYYSQQCYRLGGANYQVPNTSLLTCYINHAIECSKDWAESILTEPWFVYSLLSRTSAIKTASYFRLINEKYANCEDYLSIAKMLVRHSVALDVGPNTLFYYLKKKIGLANKIVEQLCTKASKLMDLEYYYPVKEVVSSGIAPERQLQFKNFSDPIKIPEKYINGNYIVYVDTDKVIIQDLETEEIIKQKHFSNGFFRYYVFRDYLYVHHMFVPNHLETYKLPSLESVFYSEDKPELPEGYSWRSVAYGCNGIQYQYAQPDDKNLPQGVSVYNMHTGEEVIHSSMAANASAGFHDIEFCNEYMLETYNATDTERLWHVPTGQMLLETDCYRHGFFTSEGDTLWYVCSKQDTFIIYKFKKEADRIQLLQMKQISTPRALIGKIGSHEDHLYIFFRSGDFWMYGPTLKYEGCQKLLLDSNFYFESRHSKNQFLYPHKDQILIQEKSHISYFDIDQIRTSLKEDPAIETDEEPYDVFVVGSRLVLLGKTCHIYSSRSSYVQTEKLPKFRYHNIYTLPNGRKYALGTYSLPKNGYFVQMVTTDSLQVGLRFNVPLNESADILESAFFHDNKIGMILRKRESTNRIFHAYPLKGPNYECSDTPDVKEEICHRYIIRYFDCQDDFREYMTWEPDFVECYSEPQIIIEQGQTYLAFSSVYVDEEHSELRIYHATTHECVYTLRYDHARTHVRSNFYNINGHLGVKYKLNSEYNHYLLEIDFLKNETIRYKLPENDILGIFGNELALSSLLTTNIIIYSTATKSIRGHLETKCNHRCYRVLHKNNDIIVFYSSGVCEIFDYQTLSYKYSQMFTSAMEYVRNWPESDMIYIGTNKSDHFLYKKGNVNEMR